MADQIPMKQIGKDCLSVHFVDGVFVEMLNSHNPNIPDVVLYRMNDCGTLFFSLCHRPKEALREYRRHSALTRRMDNTTTIKHL